MGTIKAVEDLITSLTLDQHGMALAEAARALAGEVDNPPEKGSISSTVKELRATLAELVIGAKKSGNGNSDEEASEHEWAGIAAVPDLAEVRNTAKSVKGNARPRSGGGRKAAS